MNIIKKLFTRFRAWQRNPRTYAPMSRKEQHCLNCGQDFEGNYCPRCGQEASTGRLSWNTVWVKVIDVWDVEQHSLPLTLWHLIWRPGYLIRRITQRIYCFQERINYISNKKLNKTI